MKKIQNILMILILWTQLFCNQNMYGQSGIQNLSKESFQDNPLKQKEWWGLRRSEPLGMNRNKALWDAYRETKTNLLKEGATTLSTNWTNKGPENRAGKMLCHAFDPTNNQIIWAGSAGGGLWRTLNGGTSWQPMTDQLPNLSVSAVAINPQNPLVMLMGTGEADMPFQVTGLMGLTRAYGLGVMKSTDGGLTWDTTNLNNIADTSYFGTYGFAWDPINTNKVYLACDYGVYMSLDAGSTWALKGSGFATSIIINKKNPDIVYAAIQESGISGGGIVKTTDGGTNWTVLTNGLPTPTNVGRTALTISDSFPNVLFASIAKPFSSPDWGALEGVYKTSNGGSSWSFVTADTVLLCPYGFLCLGWFSNVIMIHPQDTNTLYLGGVFIHKSTDGGTTWAKKEYTPLDPLYGYMMHVDHHSLAFEPGNAQKIYSFNDGGVYVSPDAGANWYEKNTGLCTYQLYTVASAATDPDLVIGGPQDRPLSSTDLALGTNQWQLNQAFSDVYQTIIDYTNANVWYATSIFIHRAKTIDGGANYTFINNGITETNMRINDPLILHPANPQILFTSSSLKIYKTVNGGTLWNPVSNTPDITMFAIDKINPNIVYAANEWTYTNTTSKIYRSTDGGTNWVQVNSPGNIVTDIEPDPNVQGVLYATRSTYFPGQQVWKSTNMGNTWTNISGNFPEIPTNSIVINPNNTNHLYVATDLGVFLSTDAGATWAQYNNNLPNVQVTDIHYYAPDSTLRIATYGRGFWFAKATDITSSINSLDAASVAGINVFPNPVSQETKIDYTLLKSGKVEITVYNIYGQEICKLLNQYQQTGKHNTTWNRKNKNGTKVSAGSYYITIANNDVFQTKKMHVVD